MRPFHLSTIGGVAWGLLAGVAGLATPAYAQRNADLEVRLDRIVDRFARKDGFMGTIAVSQRGQVLYSREIGFADRERKISLDASTQFLLASVTKQFVAVRVLGLVETGKVRLEDRLGDHLEGLPSRWQQVRIQDVLSHQSGLGDYLNPYLKAYRTRDSTLNELLARAVRLESRPMCRGKRGRPEPCKNPGNYRYSNLGYVLLSHLIEAKTQRPWQDEVMTWRYPNPVATGGRPSSGMTLTDLVPTSVRPIRALGYRVTGRGYAREPVTHPTALAGSGGLLASVVDLMQWNERLWESTDLLSAPMRELMTTPRVHGPRFGVGFGVRVATSAAGPEYFHTGHVAGMSHYLGRFSQDGLNVVVLSNVTHAKSRSLGRELIGLVGTGDENVRAQDADADGDADGDADRDADGGDAPDPQGAHPLP